jgi:hypothetical protein
VVDPEQPSKKLLDMAVDRPLLDVMKLMLGGRPLDEVLGDLAEKFDRRDVGRKAALVDRLHVQLRAHSVFAPLFR